MYKLATKSIMIDLGSIKSGKAGEGQTFQKPESRIIKYCHRCGAKIESAEPCPKCACHTKIERYQHFQTLYS